MAIKLSDKPNTDGVQLPDWPYGKIRDNSGSNDGTPVNTQVYGDFHQFFEKMMAEAGVEHNGLPDNHTNGFQLYEAFLQWYRTRAGISTANAGKIPMVNGAGDGVNMVSFPRLSSRTNHHGMEISAGGEILCEVSTPTNGVWDLAITAVVDIERSILSSPLVTARVVVGSSRIVTNRQMFLGNITGRHTYTLIGAIDNVAASTPIRVRIYPDPVTTPGGFHYHDCDLLVQCYPRN